MFPRVETCGPAALESSVIFDVFLPENGKIYYNFSTPTLGSKHLTLAIFKRFRGFLTYCYFPVSLKISSFLNNLKKLSYKKREKNSFILLFG